MISEVLGWKFNHQEGMRCKEIDAVMSIIEFPGGIPSQADQDLWTQEYINYVSAGGLKAELADIEKQFDQPLKAFALVVLSEINILRVAAGLPERTAQQLKDAVKVRL